MKPKQIWMAVVNDTDEVVFKKACPTQRQAEKAIVGYLRKDEDFDGKDFGDACFWIGEKDLRLDLMVFEMGLDDFKDVQLQAGLLIDPPPEEKVLFRVVYVIDVSADTVLNAARLVHRIMTDPDSLAPVLEVIDKEGKVRKIDLSKSD